jgi:hypothetical protein
LGILDGRFCPLEKDVANILFGALRHFSTWTWTNPEGRRRDSAHVPDIYVTSRPFIYFPDCTKK